MYSIKLAYIRITLSFCVITEIKNPGKQVSLIWIIPGLIYFLVNFPDIPSCEFVPTITSNSPGSTTNSPELL